MQMQCDGTETVATAALLPPRKEPGAGTSAPNSCASDIAIVLPEGRSQTVFRQAAISRAAHVTCKVPPQISPLPDTRRTYRRSDDSFSRSRLPRHEQQRPQQGMLVDLYAACSVYLTVSN